MAVPLDEIRETRTEDDGMTVRLETDEELIHRLGRFPLCRLVMEKIDSFSLMYHERIVKTITIIMEVNVNVLYRQCHMFLLQTGARKDGDGGGGVGSMKLSNDEVGRMFVEAWRDYVLHAHYGNNTYPQHIVLCPISVMVPNLIDYYEREFAISRIKSEDMILDYYSFMCEEIKKGTNVSRITKKLQFEFGTHVSPNHIPTFQRLYNRLVVDPIAFAKVVEEYNTVTTAPAIKTSLCAVAQQRGRKRRDPDKIIQSFETGKRKRDVWYEQTPAPPPSPASPPPQPSENYCWDELIQSLCDDIVVIDATTAAAAASAATAQQQKQGLGSVAKDIKNCCDYDDGTKEKPTTTTKPLNRRSKKNPRRRPPPPSMLSNIKLF